MKSNGQIGAPSVSMIPYLRDMDCNAVSDVPGGTSHLKSLFLAGVNSQNHNRNDSSDSRYRRPFVSSDVSPLVYLNSTEFRNL